ncbi:hypothetical protein ACF0H5_024457 [Mactra antiquata]
MFFEIASGGIKNVNEATYTHTISDTNQAHAYAYWFEEDAGYDYKMSYRIATRSTIPNNNGLDYTAALCDLQRMENMINGCTEDHEDDTQYGKIEIDQAIIVTWMLRETNPDIRYYYQAVIANGKDLDNNNKRETFIIFLYNDPPTFNLDYQFGKINGKFQVASNREYAKICDETDVEQRSNCRCNGWMAGIYVFATRDNDASVNALNLNPDTYLRNTCDLDQSNFDDMCAEVVPNNRRNQQLNCKPNKKPQDSCTEDLFCQLVPGISSWRMVFSLVDRLNIHFTDYIFLNPNAADYAYLFDYEFETSLDCRGTFQETSPGSNIYYAEETVNPNDPSCGRLVSNDVLTFAIYTYNRNDYFEYEVAHSNSLFIRGVCAPKDLPLTIPVSITVNTAFFTVTENPNTNAGLYAFFAKKRSWTTAEGAVIPITSGGVVEFGDIIFLMIGLEYGDNDAEGYVEPYGAFVDDCQVSNSNDFSTVSPKFSRDVITDGCKTTGTSGNAFDVDDTFEHVFDENGNTNSQYNYVIMSGALTVGVKLKSGINDLYFRCSCGLCYNKDFMASSKCSRSCNADIDYTGDGRKKRSTDDYERKIVQGHVRIYKPADEDTVVAESCVTDITAIATFVALLILLLTSSIAAILLFVKLHRKRQY